MMLALSYFEEKDDAGSKDAGNEGCDTSDDEDVAVAFSEPAART